MKRILVLAVSGLLLVGCKSDPEPSAPSENNTTETGGKGDQFTPCSPDEELLRCMADECPGLVGNDLIDCIDASPCADVGLDTPDDCLECVQDEIDSDSDPAAIADGCAELGFDVACNADEPVLVCINDQCSGLVDDDFDTCFEDNCEDDAIDTPTGCGLCLVSGFESGLDAAGITSECTGSGGSTDGGGDLSGVACSADDQQLFSCIASECPDAETSEDVGECIADGCTDAAAATRVSCIVCVDAALTAGSADPEAACNAPNSAPCTTVVANALIACAEVTCAGLQGDALDECMDAECPDVFDDVTEQCANCVIGLNSQGVALGEGARHCGGG